MLWGIRNDPPWVTGIDNGFSSADWLRDWVLKPGIETSANVEWAGSATKLICRAGEHWGVKGVNHFSVAVLGQQAQRCVLQYDMMFDPEWPTIAAEDQGKLMMIASTADGEEGTTGGNKADGYNGFSIRTQGMTESGGKIPMALYVYHVDQPDDFGEKFPWFIPGGGMVRGAWYRVRIEVKINDPDKSDGEIAVFVDGMQAYRKSNFRLRLSASALPGIERVIPTIYWGGSAVPAVDAAVHVKNLSVKWAL